MLHELNALGQQIGFRVDRWTPPSPPPRTPMTGRWCRTEPLESPIVTPPICTRRTRSTPTAATGPTCPTVHSSRSTTTTRGSTRSARLPIRSFTPSSISPPASAVGVASYLRIDPAAGSIEVGHINFSPRLQRTVAATEAMYLMMKRAFELGYRRYEWKCHALNAAVARRGAAARVLVRGHLPPGARRQGAQPRHRLVRGDRRRMARARSGVQPLARSGELRRASASSARRSAR